MDRAREAAAKSEARWRVVARLRAAATELEAAVPDLWTGRCSDGLSNVVMMTAEHLRSAASRLAQASARGWSNASCQRPTRCKSATWCLRRHEGYCGVAEVVSLDARRAGGAS